MCFKLKLLGARVKRPRPRSIGGFVGRPESFPRPPLSHPFKARKVFPIFRKIFVASVNISSLLTNDPYIWACAKKARLAAKKPLPGRGKLSI